MNDLIVREDIKIENLIYEIRGKQVMIDSDLACIYGCKNGTKEVNQAVKNNLEKFPERYSFRLTDEESENLLVKKIDQKIETRGGKYKNPRVFTEQGIYMLATVLKSKIATEVTIAIMDAFVIMKNYINTSLIEQKYFNELTIKNTEDIKLLKESFDKLNSKEEINHIFYDGEIYDAYSILIDILSTSKEEIIIIDNYAGKKLFDTIRNIRVNIKVYTSNIDIISKDKYEKQYSNLEIINTNIFHDRFILIDRKVLYHSGASFKDLGKKCFAITKIEDITIINNLLDRLEELDG